MSFVHSITEFSLPLNHLGLLVIRVSTAALMATHGSAKLTNLLAGNVQFMDPFGIGPAGTLTLVVFAELICAILIALGFLTRVACFPLIINMSMAFFVAHAGDPLRVKELALLYLLLFCGLLLTGAGRYSLDYLFFNTTKRKSTRK